MSEKLVNKLGDFLNLEREFRSAANRQALGFAACNLSRNLLKFNTAVLFRSDYDAGSAEEHTVSYRVQAVSGTSSFDEDAPLLRALRLELDRADDSGKTAMNSRTVFTRASDLAGDGEQVDLLFCPLWFRQKLLGVLVLIKAQPWLEQECGLATQVQQALAHATYVFAQEEQSRRPSMVEWTWGALQKTRLRWVLAAALVLALLPVRQSVIADGQVVARTPDVIASGLNAVVRDVLVSPNQMVRKGDLLLTFDPTEHVHERSQIVQQLALAEEQLRKAEQQSFAMLQGQIDGTAVFAKLRSEVELKQIELEYIDTLMERLEVRAPADGIVMFSSARDWLGRSVATGEKIMELADADDRQFEIWLDASDAISLNSGGDVKFFPDAFPLSAMAGAVDSVGFYANKQLDDRMAYRITASVNDDDEKVRLGMQGTARLYGDRVLLGYYLLRKPLSSVRQLVGV